MGVDFDALTLGEFIGLQSELVAQMSRRFQQKLALGFGDVAGRALQQWHITS